MKGMALGEKVACSGERFDASDQTLWCFGTKPDFPKRDPGYSNNLLDRIGSLAEREGFEPSIQVLARITV
jgi:hypothetical protein